MFHQPVLTTEVLDSLDLSNRHLIIDATLGLGGHSEAILSDPRFKGKVIGIDQDSSMMGFAQRRLSKFGDRVVSGLILMKNIKGRVIKKKAISKITTFSSRDNPGQYLKK